MNLLRVAIWRMMERFIIGSHGTCQQTGIAHLVMCGFEDGLSVWGQTRHKGIVRVHPHLFEQRRGAKVDNDKEGHFLDGSIDHELEDAFQGYPAAADGLEYRCKRGRRGIELVQEALGEGTDIPKTLKPSIRGIDSRRFIPEQFLLTEKSRHLVGLSGTKSVYKCQVGGIRPDITGHILIESLQITGFANGQVCALRR